MPKLGDARKGPEIRAWFALNKKTQCEVARNLGVTNQLVSHTVAGNNNNRRVLLELLRIGVPVEYLALPDDAKVTL